MEDCIIHHTKPGPNGYGRSVINGKETTAHRAAWIRSYGEIPDGLLVMHKCDNRRCVNLNHLSLGTHAENSADMVKKGRSARGERNSQSKLTESDILWIRLLRRNGASQRVIAEDFGVNQALIWLILHRKAWGHVA